MANGEGKIANEEWPTMEFVNRNSPFDVLNSIPQCIFS